MNIVSKTEFDDKISGILSRVEYMHLRNGVRDFIGNIKESVGRWLRNLLENAFSGVPDAVSISDGISVAFLIAGILIIMGIVVFITVKAGKPFERNKKIREILGERIDGRATTESLREKASECGRQGEYRQAIRYGYIALLLLMHERDILYLEETKTNREILQTLKRGGFPLLTAFERLADVFNASWYGHKEYTRDAYGSWNENMNLIWSRVSANEEKSQ